VASCNIQDVEFLAINIDKHETANAVIPHSALPSHGLAVDHDFDFMGLIVRQKVFRLELLLSEGQLNHTICLH